MKTGYPFLRIAQKHNLDYGTVLMAADYCKDMDTGQIGYQAFMSLSNEALADVNKATDYFMAQQVGLIEMTDYVEIS